MVTEMVEVKLQSTLNKVADIAQRILLEAKDCHVWLLKGDLGSGKTTLVRDLVRSLSSTDQATSPTYSLVNEYRLQTGRSLFHMDLYRLRNIDEVLELGITEMLDSGDICIVEWPEMIENLIQRPYLEITIDRISDSERSYQIRKYE